MSKGRVRLCYDIWWLPMAKDKYQNASTLPYYGSKLYDFLQIVTKFPASLDIAKFKKIHAFQVNKCSIILLCIYIIWTLIFVGQ